MSSYEHRPYNPNKGGISRSGLTTDNHRLEPFKHHPHPSDRRLDWTHWLLLAVIAAGLTCAVLGITVWADAPMEVAR